MPRPPLARLKYEIGVARTMPEASAFRQRHRPGLAAGSMREGEGWSVCGTPLGLGEHRILGRCSRLDKRRTIDFGFIPAGSGRPRGG